MRGAMHVVRFLPAAQTQGEDIVFQYEADAWARVHNPN